MRHGDIILLENNDETTRSVLNFFEDLLSWRQVDVKPVNPNQSQRIVLENLKISTKWNLKQLTKFISEKLEVDPEKLRLAFTSDSNCISPAETAEDLSGASKVGGLIQFLRSNNEGTVKDFLIGTSSIDIITVKYEITKDPVERVENQVRYFIESNGTCPSIEGILPVVVYLTPYVSTINDLLKEIITDVSVDLKRFRLLEVVNGKIRRTFASGSVNESLTPIDPEKCSLYLEEGEVSGAERLISCFTFEKTPTKPFGIPFKIDIRPDETVKALKTRIIQRLSDNNLTLFLFSGARERKLDDPNEILFNLPGGAKFTDEDQLGLMMNDPRKLRSSSGFDGAIRFRK